MNDGQTPSRFTKEQKVGTAFLLVFTVITIGLGALQLRNTIYGPFVVRTTANAELVLDEDAKLQQIDTDQDGINDFEELNFYETSPYLPDSDSDGVKDKVELERGTNPLCPEGQSCDNKDIIITTSSTSPVLNVPSANISPLDTLTQGQGILSPEELQLLANDPVLLRELLQKSGKFTKEDLAKIDDATLKKFATDVLGSTNPTQ